MEISAKEVMNLRQRTGVSMMECKAALAEAGGDAEKAIDILKKKGAAKAAKKADRETHEGRVAIRIGDGKASIVSVLCETDFVARNDNFVKLVDRVAEMVLEQGESAKDNAEAMVKEAVTSIGENLKLGELRVIEGGMIGSYIHSNSKIGVLTVLEGADLEKAKDVAMQVAAMSPSYISPSEVSGDDVAREMEIWKEQLKTEGKPEKIWENILKGKEKKFREENALLTQAFVKDQNTTVEKYLGNAKVTAMVRVAV